MHSTGQGATTTTAGYTTARKWHEDGTPRNPMLRNPVGTSHTRRSHQHRKSTKRSKYQKTSNERQGIPREIGRNARTTSARHTSSTKWTQGTTQEGRNEKGTLALAPVPPRPEILCWKERRRGDTTGEGGERKNTTRCRGLHRQIRELLDGREQSLKNEDDYRRKVADQQAKIERLHEEIQGLRRTVAGSGFSLGRLKREVDDARKGNQELERRNHELKKELRRAGRKLLDLGN